MEELLRIIGLLREKEMEKVVVYSESNDVLRRVTENRKYEN